jgi:hypothetical protein
MNNEKNNNKTIKDKLMDISLFLLVLVLIITVIFTLDKLFFVSIENNCNYNYDYKTDMLIKDQNCDFNSKEINECISQNGNIIYNVDCTINCDYCNRDWQILNNNYKEKITWFRIILGFLLSIIFTFILFKDKILKSAFIVGSLLSLIFATIISIDLINNSLFPIIIILELVLVIFIFKKYK